jgi:predicted HNH restriction endonuclease
VPSFYAKNAKGDEPLKRRATQVHHKTYKNIFNEPLSDLLAVCASCHAEMHGIKEKPKKRRRLFSRILAKVIK